MSLLTLLALASCAGVGDERSRERPGQQAEVLAAVYAGGGQIARLDARTLEPVDAATVGFPPSTVWARSPDGRSLVVAGGNDAPQLRIVRLSPMRATGQPLRFGGRGSVAALAWASPTRIVALLGQGTTRPRAVVVDARDQSVISTTALDGSLVVSSSTSKRVIGLLGPRRSIGRARLAVVGRSGRVRVVPLPLSAGWDAVGDLQQLIPALAVDPRGRRAVVVSPGDRAVDVDLRTLAVRPHALSRRESLLGRLRDWLEPKAEAKGIPGLVRTAVWIDDRWVAVTGYEYREGERAPRPVGVELIDSRTWRVDALEDDRASIAAADGVLLVFGADALTAYDVGARRRLRLPGEATLGDVDLAGRYVYVPDGSAMRFRVIDLHAGRVIGTRTRPSTTVVLAPAP